MHSVIEELSESRVQDHLVAYIKLLYPEVRFSSSLTGEKTSGRAKSRNKRIQHSNGQPDMNIYAKRGVYCGLALELKAVGRSPFKKDGNLKKSKHLEEQQGWLDYLTEQGWYATFAVGLGEACKIVDKYLKLENNGKW